MSTIIQGLPERKLLSLALFLIILIGSCKKNNSINEPVENPVEIQTKEKIVKGTVIGTILDEHKVPVIDADIRISNVTLKTDKYGKFIVPNVEFYDKSGMVQINKEGYFEAFRSFIAQKDSLNEITVELIPKKLVGTVKASEGGTIALSDNTEILIHPGILIEEDTKAPYSGIVNIYAISIDPTRDDSKYLLTGDARGFDNSGKEGMLESFHHLTIELETEQGNKLQIASGKTVEIKAPIPATLQSIANDTISLFYFNTEERKWIKSGKADKQGNQYHFVLNHFSSYNLSNFNGRLSYFRIQLENFYGESLPLLSVTISSVIGRYVISGPSNSFGEVYFYGSGGVDATITVHDPCSKKLLVKKELGMLPFNTGKINDLGKVQVPDENFIHTTIPFFIKQCEDKTLPSYILFQSEDDWQYQNVDQSSGYVCITFALECFPGNDIGKILVFSSLNDTVYEGRMYRETDGIITMPGLKNRYLDICGNNLFPDVDAGLDQTITLPNNSVTLSASATDADGQITSYKWTKVSGPAGDNIALPGSSSTSVSFINEGTYIYKITVEDNEGATGSDEVTIVVKSATNVDNVSTMKIKVDNTEYNLAAPTDDIKAMRSGNATTISGKTENFRFGNSQYAFTSFIFSGNADPGNYNISSGFIYAGDKSYMIKEGAAKVSIYGNTNHFVEGIFSGKAILGRDTANANATKYPITINFKALRQQ
ncbi:MAG: PKD domain-containing protein [Chitinophagaceae bacterium]|nr:PKD domain-containing protein [Chitinophagaceae bacterium]